MIKNYSYTLNNGVTINFEKEDYLKLVQKWKENEKKLMEENPKLTISPISYNRDFKPDEVVEEYIKNNRQHETQVET